MKLIVLLILLIYLTSCKTTPPYKIIYKVHPERNQACYYKKLAELNSKKVRCYDLNATGLDGKYMFDGWMLRHIGEILLNIDEKHMSEAEHWISKAIEADRGNGMMFHLGQDYAAYAGLFKRIGDTPKVKENLGKAVEIYKKCGSDGWVEKAEKELKGLSRKK